MRDLIHSLVRRVEDFFFVLDLTRLQSWRRRLTPTLQEKEEQRRNRERFEATRDRTASF